MKNRILTILLAASIAFNLAFVTLFIHRNYIENKFNPTFNQPRPFDRPPKDIPHGPNEGFGKNFDEAKKELRDLRNESKNLRDEFVKLLLKEELSEEEIETQKEKMLKQYNIMERDLAEKMIILRKELGAEEFRKRFEPRFKRHKKKHQRRNQ